MLVQRLGSLGFFFLHFFSFGIFHRNTCYTRNLRDDLGFLRASEPKSTREGIDVKALVPNQYFGIIVFSFQYWR